MGPTVFRAAQDADWVAHLGAKHDASGQVSIHDFTINHVPFAKIRRYAPLKRTLDLIVVALVAPVAAIVVIISALAIWAMMGRPIFLSQVRVGVDGRLFRMHKLRTMIGVADTTPTLPDDERITPLGGYLRRLHIDELPQLWNVIKGDMSLVGPRPEQPCLAEQYTRTIPAFAFRVLVLPGITGFAQLRSGYAANTAETKAKLAHDLYYLTHSSLAFDVQILIETFWALCRGKELASR